MSNNQVIDKSALIGVRRTPPMEMGVTLILMHQSTWALAEFPRHINSVAVAVADMRVTGYMFSRETYRR